MKRKIIGIFIVLFLIGVSIQSLGMKNKNSITDEYNYNIRPKDNLGYFNNDVVSMPICNDLPEYFSWKDYEGGDYTTPVKDQAYPQYCGSCWTFTTTAILESSIKIAGNNPNLDIDLSEQYILSCLPEAGGCSGGLEDKAFELIMSTSSEGNFYNGIIPEDCFPYQADDGIPCSDKCEDWIGKLIPIYGYGTISCKGDTTLKQNNLKSHIISIGPISGGMLSNDFFNEWLDTHHNPEDYIPYGGYTSGVNHLVTVIGWKDDPSIEKGGYWICKNSHGTEQGYDGFFNIEYEALNIMGSTTLYSSYASAGIPDLTSYGSLSWVDIAPGGTINGTFSIENIGQYGSLLDWEITEWPDWGEWTLVSDNETRLTPFNGQFDIIINVKAPNETNKEFTGELKIVNQNNPDDFEIIQITLTTPKNKAINTSLFFQRFFHCFPLFEKILNQLI